MNGIVFDPFRLPTFDDSWKRECRTCAHLVARVSMNGGCHTIMQCKAANKEKNGQHAHCIDVRAESGACGPGAKLWMRA